MPKSIRTLILHRIIKIIPVSLLFCYVSACTPIPQNHVHYTGTHTKRATIFHHSHHSDNLWTALGSNFNLPYETEYNAAVNKQIQWYIKHPTYFKQIAKQAKPYLYYIFQEVKRRNLPSELALIPIVESEYNPFAYSHAGAMGLWQMMPGTASGFGLKVDWWYDGRRDIIASTHSALDYLSYLGTFFHGDWLLAIAAYDTGEGTVDLAMERNIKKGKPIDFWHLNLSMETTTYIPKLLALACIIKHPNRYHIQFPTMKDDPYFEKVDVGSQIDLTRAAKLAGISTQELIALNPGFNRWATDPNGPHHLLIPINKVKKFKKELAAIPKEKRVTWIRYKVKQGDALIAIAKHNKTTLNILKNVNHIRNNRIKPGQILLIPTSTNNLTKLVNQSEKHYLSSLHHIHEIKITNYIIKKGDSLKCIAKKYHVKEHQIRFWNGLRNTKKLKIGKKLIIWPPHKRVAHFKKPHVQSIKHYKIKPNDSLSLIAHRFHITTHQLRKANHLKGDLLHIGRVLIIPPHHKYIKPKTTEKHLNKKKNHVKNKRHVISILKTHNKKIVTHQPKKIVYHIHAGDNLSKIAHKFKIKTSDLVRWNRINNPKQLQLNQTIVIYQ